MSDKFFSCTRSEALQSMFTCVLFVIMLSCGELIVTLGGTVSGGLPTTTKYVWEPLV